VKCWARRKGPSFRPCLAREKDIAVVEDIRGVAGKDRMLIIEESESRLLGRMCGKDCPSLACTMLKEETNGFQSTVRRTLRVDGRCQC